VVRKGKLGHYPFPSSLALAGTLFYAGDIRGSDLPKIMQRLTARLLLLLALAGTFLPVALQAMASPPHACCRRKGHHCHDSLSNPQETTIRAAGCCDCGRGHAVTTVQCASPQPVAAGEFTTAINGNISQSQRHAPASERFALQSSRAPPAC
jgi:hypothetical protein